MNKKSNAKILAFANQKGGVGKTTSVSTIGGILAHKGLKVLLVDADQQCNLTSTYLKEVPKKTLMDTFEEGEVSTIRLRERLALLPGSDNLCEVDSLMEEPDDRFLLSRAFTKIKENYDFILIDCPPSMSWITINALTAADYVFAPAQADPKSLHGVSKLAEACYRAGTTTRINGVFFTMFKKNTKLAQRMEKQFRARYGDIIMNATVRSCVKAAECAEVYQDLISYAPTCATALDYNALVDEIIMIINNNNNAK